MEIVIRCATQEDKPEWIRMRKGIWTDWTDEYLDVDMDQILASENDVVYFAFVEGAPAGMIEVRIKDSAEGCTTNPIGYLEAWFVDESFRGKGVAGALTQAAEEWAREKGCAEMASDTWLENQASIRAHAKMGYYEVERLVHFVKQL
jgi:aminoglycoside 6'-N-acetyltransferase I